MEDPDLAEAIERERQLLTPRVRADPASVGRLLHPDYLEYGASGRAWDRDAVIDSLAGDPGRAGTGRDFTPVRLAAGVVLLTYRVDGEDASLRSSIWVRDARHGWRLRFHQGTRLP